MDIFPGQEYVDNYVKIFTAVNGKEIDEKGILEQSERMHTLQRFLNIRMGYGEWMKILLPTVRWAGQGRRISLQGKEL